MVLSAPATTRTACRACGAAETAERVFVGSEQRFGLGGDFSVVRCRSCGFIWTDLPEGFDLQEWYDRGYWCSPSDDGPAPHTWQSPAIRNLWRTLVGSPRPSRWIVSGRVLDIGCGPGHDALEMMRAGADVVGIDTSTRGLEQARRAGVAAVCADALDLPLRARSFDAVVMSHVLEHLPNPEGTLAEVHRVLKPGGRLLLLLPNAGGIQRRFFGVHWGHWHLPYHLWHFNRQTVVELVSREGFRIKSARTASPGDWLLFSAGSRWPALRRLQQSRPLFHLMRLGLAPVLMLMDLAGRGDCLVVLAQRI